ncbi:hypothetical protein FHX37_0470 [Haloactinospora alba]|uniref:Uncharacterized protein n=1 Tax=Haloactinospora alba TaxID=405555 RepID=A0A543NFH3_9ACTN|nr:hypothetical protein [Haloactinospora alba]TQN30588.1 hypothetical protein FHX37_0470 [Haloactinospora alba]
MTEWRDTIGDLRRQLRELLAEADTTELPTPDRINPSDHPMPGPQWEITAPHMYGRRAALDRWLVRSLSDASLADAVYLSTPDDSHVEDVQALRVDEARRVAMALLAACDHADGTREGVAYLADRRRT